MIKFKYFSILIYLLLTIVSCKNTNEYRVDASFADYLQRFESEASARGRTFDLKANGLIIEFANLKDNTAGLTHYEDPIRIEIDKTYWNDISNSAGADLMKEDLLFHELGHGLLKRDHLNTTLDNGDWKSIMCGGDKVGDRSWNINYHGTRRAYYLEELFNESTKPPDFSSTQLLADTTGYVPTLQLSFDTRDKIDAGFDIVDVTDYKTSIVNKRLCFESKVDQVYLVFVKVPKPIDINSNFSYELTLDYPTGDSSNQYGIIFGTSTTSSTKFNDPIEFFSISNNQKMYMGNRSWYSYFTELKETKIVTTGKNKLKVFKIGGMLYYFINNRYCYSSEIVAKDNLDQFGFMVPNKGTIWLDNLSISQKSAIKTSSKIIQNQPLELKIVTIKSPNQNNVKNK